MRKYIDAEKLKAEIKRQKHELELSIQSQGDYGQSCHIVAYENILSLIGSLQQEKPQVADASKMEQPEVELPRWKKCHFQMGTENPFPRYLVRMGVAHYALTSTIPRCDEYIPLSELAKLPREE